MGIEVIRVKIGGMILWMVTTITIDQMKNTKKLHL